MSTKPFIAIVILALSLAGCRPMVPPSGELPTSGQSSGAPAQVETTLTVMAAASLTQALAEIGQAFEQEHPGVSVAFNFAGSQQLAQQLVQGAPADVFASANQKQM